MKLEAMCLDCEEQWDPDVEEIHCICNEPQYDAWILFIRDENGKWVRALAEQVDRRYFKDGYN